MSLAEAFRELEESTGIRLKINTVRSVGGGDTNESILANDIEGNSFFLKLARPDSLEPFLTEKKSLELLRATNTIRVPEPLFAGHYGDKSLLILEALELVPFSRGDQGKLGSALAEMHREVSHDARFGGTFDNYIGATPQPNPSTHSWADFFTEHRLLHQFKLAETAGRPYPESGEFIQVVHLFLESLDTSPALVHGDLWSGNASDTADGIPVIFDPAAYYSDREVDIAFTKLFGGFDESFYAAYREVHSEPPPILHEIYNLYHLLNHDHLFGSPYRNEATQAINRIINALS